jgi:hypothetical protein
VGAWILGHFGMPAKTIAERQFNLSFLNTAVSALALIVFGLGLAVGIFPGEGNLLLTLLQAGAAALGLVAVRVIALRAAKYAAPMQSKRPKVAAAIVSLADAVAACARTRPVHTPGTATRDARDWVSIVPDHAASVWVDRRLLSV